MSTTTASSSPTSLPDRGERSAGRGPLYETATTTATDYWNDSCSVEELTYAIEHGAVGATSNPTIVGEVLKKEMHLCGATGSARSSLRTRPGQRTRLLGS